MRTESCREWHQLLGAHALGRLEEDERVGLDAHLQGCPRCRTELEALSSVAALLPLADPERFHSTPAPPASLGDRVAGRIAAERQSVQRRRWGFRVGVSGAVAMAAVILALILVPGDGGPEPSRHVEFAGLPGGIEIAATLKPHAFGTEIEVYVKGVSSGTLCRVFLRGAKGERLSAGSFRYRWGEDSEAVLSSALDLSRTRAIGVRVGNRTFVAPVRGGRVASPTPHGQTAGDAAKHSPVQSRST